jgi:hypothetical protein
VLYSCSAITEQLFFALVEQIPPGMADPTQQAYQGNQPGTACYLMEYFVVIS